MIYNTDTHPHVDVTEVTSTGYVVSTPDQFGPSFPFVQSSHTHK